MFKTTRYISSDEMPALLERIVDGNYSIAVPVADHIASLVAYAGAISLVDGDKWTEEWYNTALADWWDQVNALSVRERTVVQAVCREEGVPLPSGPVEDVR